MQLGYVNIDTNGEELKHYYEICNYIENNLDLNNNLITEFKKICEYIASLEILLNKKIINELILNNKINVLLGYIIENYSKFENTNFKNLLAYNNAITLLVDYAEKNNIELSLFETKEELNENESSTFNKYDNNYLIYINEIKKYKILTKEESFLLLKKIKQGDEVARQKLICCNLRFVVYFAQKYMGFGLEFLDLIQEGNIGLMKAIDYFNPDLDLTFTYYASYWIGQTIQRAIQKTSRNIRVPTHKYEAIIKYNKAFFELENTLGRKPTDKELAQKLNISEKEAIELSIICKSTISLNSICSKSKSGNKQTEIINFFKEPVDFVEDEIIPKIRKEEIESIFLISSLTEKEKYVIIHYYGFKGEQMSLAEIGRLLNVSRERISKIHRNAIDKIRRTDTVLKFTSYMDDPESVHEKILEYRKQSYKY